MSFSCEPAGSSNRECSPTSETNLGLTNVLSNSSSLGIAVSTCRLCRLQNYLPSRLAKRLRSIFGLYECEVCILICIGSGIARLTSSAGLCMSGFLSWCIEVSSEFFCWKCFCFSYFSEAFFVRSSEYARVFVNFIFSHLLLLFWASTVLMKQFDSATTKLLSFSISFLLFTIQHHAPWKWGRSKCWFFL